MDPNKLQSDKLSLIHWIAQIQDYVLIEKIKQIMENTSNLDAANFSLKKDAEIELNAEIENEIIETKSPNKNRF